MGHPVHVFKVSALLVKLIIGCYKYDLSLGFGTFGRS